MKEGVLLLGHGSRREEGNDVVRRILEQVKEKGTNNRFYEVGFLQFADPTLAEGVEKLIAAGAEKVIVVPLFLVAGNHIWRDIPGKLLLQKTTHPHIKFVFADHLGSDPRIADIVLDRIEEGTGLVE